MDGRKEEMDERTEETDGERRYNWLLRNKENVKEKKSDRKKGNKRANNVTFKRVLISRTSYMT